MGTGELVGRDALLHVLSGALTTTADRGGAFLLLGEPGIGKTTCLATIETTARKTGHLIFGTSGSQAETKLPFAGLHQLLRPLLASTDTLPDAQRRALRTALGLHEGGPADRFAVSVAVLNLLRDAAEHRPLLITADEIQWLDEDTRHILAFVTRQLDRHRVVVVVTSSSVEGLPDLRDVFPRNAPAAAGRIGRAANPRTPRPSARRHPARVGGETRDRQPAGAGRAGQDATVPRRDPHWILRAPARPCPRLLRAPSAGAWTTCPSPAGTSCSSPRWHRAQACRRFSPPRPC